MRECAVLAAMRVADMGGPWVVRPTLTASSAMPRPAARFGGVVRRRRDVRCHWGPPCDRGCELDGVGGGPRRPTSSTSWRSSASTTATRSWRGSRSRPSPPPCH